MTDWGVAGAILGAAAFAVSAVYVYGITPLQTKRMDLLWEYARSLDRSLESQHRMLKMLSVALGIPIHDEEDDGEETEDQP